MKTIILPKPYHQIFEDAARSFAAEESDDILCFGVQDWTLEEIKKQQRPLQGKLIAYQSELLYGGNMPFRNDEYVGKLKLFDEIWEYSLHNIDFLQQHGVTNVVYKPLLPSPILKEPPVEKDIDILHYGYWTRHRTDFLNRVVAEGFKVYDVLREHGDWVYGAELHQLILRSKMVLGIHSFPHSSIQESFRYQYPLSNGIDVLAEKSLSNPLQLEEFTDADDMVQHLLKKGFHREKNPSYYLENCFFPHCSLYQEEAVRYVGSNQPQEVFRYVLRRMDEDSVLISEVRKETNRTEDVRMITSRLFNALMWMTVRLNKTDNIGKDEKKSMHTVMQKVYERLYRTSLREKLKSTGGHIMPWLRCALMLNGWRLFRGSIELSLSLKKDNKFIRYLC